MMVVELSRHTWKKATWTSIYVGIIITLSIIIIGVKKVNIVQEIVSGFIPAFIFSTLMMGLATFWFSFSRKQPWIPALTTIFPILAGLLLAYFCYDLLEIRNSNHENYISQGLADFLKMISSLLASLVAIMFSLVVLRRNPSNQNMEEE